MSAQQELHDSAVSATKPSADLITRAPKALLHDHLDGGVRPQTIIDLAQESGYAELPATDAEALGRWFRYTRLRRSIR